MNYPAGSVGSMMCRAWAYLVRRYNPQARLAIFYVEPDQWVLDHIWHMKNVEFHRMSVEGIPTDKKAVGYAIEGMEYKIAFWDALAAAGIRKTVFVDADAFVLSPLDHLWEIAGEKWFSAVYEADYMTLDTAGLAACMKPHLNSGVFCYNAALGNDITVETLMTQYALDGKVSWQTGDQGLLNSYFARQSYDWTHPKLEFEWNVMAWTGSVDRADDGEIVAWSPDKKPQTVGATPQWKWWGDKRRAKIFHALWKKWWDLPEAEKLWEYVKAKVNPR